MVAAACSFTLHSDGRFISLDVTACEQIFAHGPGDCLQPCAALHHPPTARHRRDVDTRFPPESLLLAVEWLVIAILRNDRVDDHRVGRFALLDDLLARNHRCAHPRLLAPFTGTLLTLDHLDEILRGLHIEFLAAVVADRLLLPAALRAGAL